MATTSPVLRRLLFVMNPISGDIDKAETKSVIEAFCAEYGHSASFFATTGQDDLQRLRWHLDESSYEAVFAAGGDGTVSLTAQALLNRHIPLGIVPLGSGNGLSKDLGISQNLTEALEIINQHQIKAMDTLTVGGHCCVHLADLGFNALVVERFAQGDTRGPGAYVRVALQEYLSYEPAQYRIRSEAECWEGSAFMLTIANARTFGSNVVINPDGQLDDGRFELCVIEPFPPMAGPGILFRLYTDGFDQSMYTTRLPCRSALIETPGLAEVLVQVDGEPLRVPTPIEVRIVPGSLLVLAPKEQEQ
jgi:diacylglycerol kinase family enzyme